MQRTSRSLALLALVPFLFAGVVPSRDSSNQPTKTVSQTGSRPGHPGCFSMVWIGDTQNCDSTIHASVPASMIQWIIDNRTTMPPTHPRACPVVFVGHLGDISSSVVAEAESVARLQMWADAIDNLDAQSIPWALCPGNHCEALPGGGSYETWYDVMTTDGNENSSSTSRVSVMPDQTLNGSTHFNGGAGTATVHKFALNDDGDRVLGLYCMPHNYDATDDGFLEPWFDGERTTHSDIDVAVVISHKGMNAAGTLDVETTIWTDFINDGPRSEIFHLVNGHYRFDPGGVPPAVYAEVKTNADGDPVLALVTNQQSLGDFSGGGNGCGWLTPVVYDPQADTATVYVIDTDPLHWMDELEDNDDALLKFVGGVETIEDIGLRDRLEP